MATQVSLNAPKNAHLHGKQSAYFMRFSKGKLTIKNLIEDKVETYICRASSLVFLSVVRPYQEDFRYWNIGQRLVIEKKHQGSLYLFLA